MVSKGLSLRFEDLIASKSKTSLSFNGETMDDDIDNLERNLSTSTVNHKPVSCLPRS